MFNWEHLSGNLKCFIVVKKMLQKASQTTPTVVQYSLQSTNK